jgi:hypothetical protein
MGKWMDTQTKGQTERHAYKEKVLKVSAEREPIKAIEIHRLM